MEESNPDTVAPGAVASLSSRRRMVAWLLVFVALPGFTAAMLPIRGTSAVSLVLLVYLLAVVIISVVGGLAPGLVAAFVAFLCGNFLLTEPYFTFRIEVVEHLIELTVFVVVAILVSVTVEVGARHRAAAEQNRVEADTQGERARQLAETDRVRSAILAAVSHDLRTPLAGIKAAVSSLRQSDVAWSIEEQAELLATIEESSDRLNGVVGNLLAMSRIRAGALSVRRRSVMVDEVVGNALLSIGPAADGLAVAVPDDLPTVFSDPDLLERVVANLVSNALRVDPSGAEVRAAVVGERVEIAVVDHGPGVPEQEWEEMFLPFHRLGNQDGHSGLGLAIARGLCEAVDASLTPSHTPGGGLTMTLGLMTP